MVDMMHKSKVEHFVLVNQGIVVNAYENKAEVVRLERVTSGLIWQNLSYTPTLILFLSYGSYRFRFEIAKLIGIYKYKV